MFNFPCFLFSCPIHQPARAREQLATHVHCVSCGLPNLCACSPSVLCFFHVSIIAVFACVVPSAFVVPTLAPTCPLLCPTHSCFALQTQSAIAGSLFPVPFSVFTGTDSLVPVPFVEKID